MSIKTVLFDLDGTLLPMDMDKFTEIYFKHLTIKAASFGYAPDNFPKSIWMCVAAMIKNTSEKTNCEVFWDTFCSIYGADAINDKPRLDEFYSNEFCNAKAACGFTEKSAEVISLLKLKGINVVLATNPLFPTIATENRIKWAGLSPDDFLLYTTYDNSCRSKPNPQYYTEITEKLGLYPQECLMVGNDVGEDMVAEDLGMKVFLLTDCLINKVGKDINQYPHGGFQELIEYINKNC
ncbi:MAG: HAD family hydrolase [Clostridia bacterium]|nr:HAD family hydrolase [Clostridia bacterium]